jgi:hypothetical protein
MNGADLMALCSAKNLFAASQTTRSNQGTGGISGGWNHSAGSSRTLIEGLVPIPTDLGNGEAQWRLTERASYMLGESSERDRCVGPYGVLQLIDGQQRMTTAYLVLCAVRDAITTGTARTALRVEGPFSSRGRCSEGRSGKGPMAWQL